MWVFSSSLGLISIPLVAETELNWRWKTSANLSR
jgi:hypothetical protein